MCRRCTGPGRPAPPRRSSGATACATRRNRSSWLASLLPRGANTVDANLEAQMRTNGRNAVRLANKVAIVTGAASGFGKAIAESYAKEGAKVVVADINGQGARDVAQAIGASATHVAVDVSKRDEVEAMVGEAVRSFG